LKSEIRVADISRKRERVFPLIGVLKPKDLRQGTRIMSRKKNLDLVVMTFVIVSVMVFGQILMRVFLEGFLTASGTKVVHLTCMFAFELRGFDFDFHLADGINSGSHGILLLKNRGVHFGRGITFARQRVTITANGVSAEINQYGDGFDKWLVHGALTLLIARSLKQFPTSVHHEHGKCQENQIDRDNVILFLWQMHRKNCENLKAHWESP